MPHKVLFTTPRGVEDLVVQELTVLGIEAHPRLFGLDGWVWGRVDEPVTLARVCYQSRTIFRGLLVLAEGEVRRAVEGLQDIYDLVYGVDWAAWLPPEATFCVRSTRNGRHAYQSPDIERTGGQAVIDRLLAQTGRRQKVRLVHPDVLIRVDVTGERCVVGIDFVGEEAMHRRGYRVYEHPAALNAALAAAMVMASGWQPHEQLVDPMCGGGTILLEAALMARKVPAGFFRKDNFAFRHLPLFGQVDFDDLLLQWDTVADWTVQARLFGSDISPRHLLGAQRNAERALVADTTRWRVMEVATLPQVFRKGEVQVLIANPPFGVRSGSPRRARDAHRDLVIAADALLPDDGRLVVITHHPEWVEPLAEAAGLCIRQRYKVLHGDLPAEILVGTRKTNAGGDQG